MHGFHTVLRQLFRKPLNLNYIHKVSVTTGTFLDYYAFYIWTVTRDCSELRSASSSVPQIATYTQFSALQFCVKRVCSHVILKRCWKWFLSARRHQQRAVYLLNATSSTDRRSSASEIKKNLSGFFHITLAAKIITIHIILTTYSARKNCTGSDLANKEAKFCVCYF
jgi:hypothetical protein